jgi:hypothetical protein
MRFVLRSTKTSERRPSRLSGFTLFRWNDSDGLLAATQFPRGSGANLAVQDSLSERSLTSCCLPDIVRRYPPWEGRTRSREDFSRTDNHFNSFQFAALLPSLAPVHLMLADTPWPHGFCATPYECGSIVRGLRTVCCLAAPTSQAMCDGTRSPINFLLVSQSFQQLSGGSPVGRPHFQNRRISLCDNDR